MKLLNRRGVVPPPKQAEPEDPTAHLVPPDPPNLGPVVPPKDPSPVPEQSPVSPPEAHVDAPPTHPEGSGDTQTPPKSPVLATPAKKVKTYTCEFCKATGERKAGAYVTAIDRKGGRHDVCMTCAPRFYVPHHKLSGKDVAPGYKVAPMTDSAVIRLVDRNGTLYPVYTGFYATLLRLVYGVEGCAEPYRDDLLGEYPVREIDIGTSVYDWESIVPWPYRWKDHPPCWHPWWREPGHKETVTRKVKDEDGEISEKTEEVTVKGKLRFAVLHRAKPGAPALSLASYRGTIDYSHGFGGVGEMSAMRDLAVERAIKAEGETMVEASRQSLQSYEIHFAKEAEEGTLRPTVAGKLLADVERLKKLAEAEDHDGT